MVPSQVLSIRSPLVSNKSNISFRFLKFIYDPVVAFKFSNSFYENSHLGQSTNKFEGKSNEDNNPMLAWI